MLFALMLKVDVGWGQGCNGCANSVLNPNLNMDLEPTPINGGGESSFQFGYVSGWFSAFNSPHHIQYNPNANPPLCDYSYQYSNGTEITCMATHQSGYSEGIYTGNVPNFVYDGFEQYCINLDIQKLQCFENDHPIVVDIRLGSGLSPWPTGVVENQAVDQFSNNTLILHSEPIDDFSVKSINLSFDMSQSSGWFDQLMINTRKINPNGTLRNAIYVTVNNVSVRCTTTALTGFVEDVFPNNTVDFEADYNLDAGFWIDTYKWTFGDGSSSTEANPNHPYATSGVYTVCLEIVNENGCCASYCRDILVNCDPLPFNITSKLDCPNAEFSAINTNGITAGISYAWNFGDGTGATGENVFHTYTQNGNYTVTCVATNNCGQTLTQTNTVAINCLCPTPVPNFTSVVNCSGHTNSVTFTSTSTGQGLSYFWEFGDGTTAIDQNPPAKVYANNGNYIVRLTVTDACGQIRSVEKVISVLCSPPQNISCGRETYPNAYLIDASNGSINFAQFVSQNGVPHTIGLTWNFTNITFVVRGNVVMDRWLSFQGCNFVFDTGASLELNNTSKLHNILFYNCKLFACDAMWKGVKSINGNHRFLSGTEIRDAEFGIEAFDNGYISVRNTKLYNNIVGIYERSNAGHSIKGNIFGRDASIKSAYPNQFIHRNIPYAGVVFDNISNGVVGSNLASDKNVFNNISVGIVSYKTNLTCVGNEFINLIGQNGFYDPDDIWKGTGANIFIYKGDNHMISENVFKGIPDCVYVGKMSSGEVNISRNNVETESGAFNFGFNTNSTFKISEHKENYKIGSKIKATMGISYDLTNSECNFEIYLNNFSSSQAGTLGNIGISGNHRTAKINILNNEFNNSKMIYSPSLSTKSAAISIYNCWNIDIYNNIFNSTSTDEIHNHIRLFSSRGNLEDNKFFNFSSNHNDVENSVLFRYQTSNWKLSCNESHGVTNGFNFSDDLAVSSGINFESNLMMDNITGLRVNNGINPQFNKGNLWNGINRKAQLLNAINLNQSLFSVNFDQVAPQTQAGASYKPYVVDPDQWFDDIELDADGCFGNRPLGLNDEDSTSMEHIFYLRNLMDSQEDISNLQSWVYNERIYQEIKSIDDNSNEYLAQITGQIPTEIVEYNNLDLSFSQILALTSLEKSTLYVIRLELDFLESERQQIFAENGELEEWSNEIISQIEYIIARIAQLKILENNVLNDITERKSEQLEEFKVLVESTDETEIFHKYMKDIHIVMSDLHLYGLNFVNSTHREILELIASQCYKEYGISVYTAASILGTLDGHDYTGEVDICNVTENRQAGINAAPSSIKIYPNPTSDKLNIEYNESIIKTEILDLSGRKLMDLSVSKDIIDISLLDEGVYFLTITGKSGNKNTVKFIKIK